MSKIHIARDHKLLGQFTPETVAEGLQTGRFRPDDLAWQDPMDAWKPLGEFTDLPVVEVDLTPPPIPQEIFLPPAPPIEEPAWERRRQLGTFRAIRETIRDILFSPTDTFRAMKLDGDVMSPLLFFVIVSSVTAWIAIGYNLAAYWVNPGSMPEALSKSMTPGMFIGTQIVGMILVPAILMAVAFIGAGFFHVVFLILGCASRSYWATFRAYCYACGCASVFKLIPTMVGTLTAALFSLFLLTIAIREAHKMDNLRAVVGVVIPSLLYVMALIALGAVLAPFIISAQGVLK